MSEVAVISYSPRGLFFASLPMEKIGTGIEKKQKKRRFLAKCCATAKAKAARGPRAKK